MGVAVQERYFIVYHLCVGLGPVVVQDTVCPAEVALYINCPMSFKIHTTVHLNVVYLHIIQECLARV